MTPSNPFDLTNLAPGDVVAVATHDLAAGLIDAGALLTGGVALQVGFHTRSAGARFEAARA